MDERKKAIYNKIRNEAKSRGNYVEFVSFSKLEKFLKCKRCFKYTYIDKIKTEFKDNLHADVGTLCHDIIQWGVTESWGRDKILKTFKDRSKIICDKFSMRMDLPLLKSTKHFFENSEYMLKLVERGVKIEFEVPVFHKLRYEDKPNKEYWLVGFLDMVIHNEDDTISIVDFKTSNKSGYVGKKKEQAFLQIYSYAYLYEALYRKRVAEVGYLFIKYCNMVFTDSKGKSRKSSKVERKDIQDEFREKDGLCDLVLTDSLDMYEFTKENRLVYIKRLLDIFHESKEEELFEGTGRDKFYCERFCEHSKSGVCDWVDKVEVKNPMQVMLDYMYKGNEL